MSDARTSLYSEAKSEIIEIVCEGPIRGWANPTPEESVYFDNTPLKENGEFNFDEVEVDNTLGTQDQAYLPQKLGTGSASSRVFNQVLDASSGAVTKTTQTQYANMATVIISLPGGLFHTQSDGDVKRNSVSLKIEVKASNVAEFQRVNFDGRDTIEGKTTAPYEREFTFPLEPYGDAPYDIRVTKTSGDQLGKNVNTMMWQSLTEVVNIKLRYPNSVVVRTMYNAKNVPSIPARGFQIYGLIVWVPSNYDPLTRTYTGEWDGTMKQAWTDNPAWIYYDMVTNPRYGLGKLIDPTLVNRVTLYTIGQYCDELLDRGDGVMEPRFTCSVYLQSAQDAYKVISDLASVFRGMIYYTNGEIYTVSDMPASAVAQYTPANVVDGLFNYTSSSRASRYTAITVQWNDPDNNFEAVPEYIEDQSAIARYGLIEKGVRAIGALSRYQARRVGKYMLLSSLLETEVVTFKVGLDSLFTQPGQILRIYDPLKSRQTQNGGRLLNASQMYAVLDREVTLEAGETYTLSLIQPNGEMIEVGVNMNNNTFPAGTPMSLFHTFANEDIPLAESVWALIADSHKWRQYRLLGITEEKSQTKGYFSLTASFYDDTKLSLVDTGEPLDAVPPPQYDFSGIQPVTNLTIREGLVYRSDIIERYVEVAWQPSKGPYLDHYIIEMSGPDGFTSFTWPEPVYRVNRASVGAYSFTIYAVDIAGKRSVSKTISIVLDTLIPTDYINVTGLELEGQGINYEFAGNSPAFVWRVTSAIDNEIGDEPVGGSVGADPWFEMYEVRIWNMDGTLRRIDYTPLPKYTYTFENNTLDGGYNKATRQFVFTVAARDRYGRTGDFISITVQNLPPVNYAELAITTGYESIFISYLPPTDIDYKKTRVYLSNVQGFTPDNVNLTNMAYEGVDVIIVLNGLHEESYYFRLEGVDDFGPAGVFSAEFNAIPGTASSLSYNLRQKITESYLYKSLLDRINMIDGDGPGSVNERISVSESVSIQTYYQDTPPDPATSMTGDLWFDTSNSNHPYRFDDALAEGVEPGSQWIDIQDAGAAGVSTYFQAEPPASGMLTGDLWFDTDDGNHPYRYDSSQPEGAEPGSRWMDIQDGLTIVNAADITVLKAQVGETNSDLTGLAVTVQSLNATVIQQGDNIDANASSIVDTQASVTAGDAVLTAAVQAEQSARVSTDGTLSAEYVLKLNANGHVAGMGIAVSGGASGPITSDVLFMADRFSVTYPTIAFAAPLVLGDGQFVRPSDAYIIANGAPQFVYMVIQAGTTVNEPSWPTVLNQTTISGTVIFKTVNYDELVPFVIGVVGGVSTVVMKTAFIEDLSVGTLKVAGGAITVNADAANSVSDTIATYLNNGAWDYSPFVTLFSVPFNVGSGYVSQVWFSIPDIELAYESYGGNWIYYFNMYIELWIGSTLIYTKAYNGYSHSNVGGSFPLDKLDGITRGISTPPITGNNTAILRVRTYGYVNSPPYEGAIKVAAKEKYLSLAGFKK